MSFEVLSMVLHHSRSTGTERVVLLGVASHQGDGGAWPSVATLSVYANVAARSVQRAAERLRDLGELQVSVQAGGTTKTPDWKRPNMYRVTITCPSNCDRTPRHRCTTCDQPASRCEHTPAELSTGVTPTSPGTDLPPDAGVTPPPDASVTPPVTPTSPELLLEPSPEPTSRSGRKSPAPPATLPCPACGQPVRIGGKGHTCRASALDLTSIHRAPKRHELSPEAVCGSCGNAFRHTSRKAPRYCPACVDAGQDSPFIECSHDGCNTAGRRVPGVTTYTCPDHRTEGNTDHA